MTYLWDPQVWRNTDLVASKLAIPIQSTSQDAARCCYGPSIQVFYVSTVINKNQLPSLIIHISTSRKHTCGHTSSQYLLVQIPTAQTPPES